jgi:c-di-GMP-binding flagellar brake protein YcgR
MPGLFTLPAAGRLKSGAIARAGRDLDARFTRLADEAPEYITPEIERRQYRRAKLVTQVKCEPLSREELLLARDISIGGIFLLTKAPLPVNTEVTVSFRLDPLTPPINSGGRIVNSVPGLGMGIQFLDLTEASRLAIQKFVDESL